jgi:membrane associated rhomboid family serine protease
VIPVKDVIPSRAVPALTIAIVSVNALVFLSGWALGVSDTWTGRFGFVPAAHDFRRLLPSMFFHEGALHCGLSLLYLWIFADNVEDRFGRARFVAFYMLCGTAAGLAQAAIAPASTVPLIGASGAAAGVMGAYFVLYPTSKVLMLVPWPMSLIEVPAVMLLGVWVSLHLLNDAGALTMMSPSGVSGGISLPAQAVAFATGALLSVILRRPLTW